METGEYFATEASFSSKLLAQVVTATAAIMAGLALIGIATTGARAATAHLWHGDIRPALLGAIAALCLGASMVFLMPAQRCRIIAAGETPQYRQIVGFWASLVLLAVLIGAAVLSKGAGDTVLGFVPRSVIFPASLGFALLFLVSFIFPGLAYRLSAPPAHQTPRQSAPGTGTGMVCDECPLSGLADRSAHSGKRLRGSFASGLLFLAVRPGHSRSGDP